MTWAFAPLQPRSIGSVMLHAVLIAAPFLALLIFTVAVLLQPAPRDSEPEHGSEPEPVPRGEHTSTSLTGSASR